MPVDGSVATMTPAIGPTCGRRRGALAYVRDPARSVDVQFGLVRRALKAAIGGRAALGIHDQDGHLLLIRRLAHTSRAGGNE
ncbi:hypothetical protein [Luteimonas sp. R10]|uniref:hypothetical protein n=1 Tax=Luteimonas sp. R10 TaxID=3108176 RepID=UPI0030891395|nr:hypothetical protein U3649_07325 [Luteimonas sp. R10]